MWNLECYQLSPLTLYLLFYTNEKFQQQQTSSLPLSSFFYLISNGLKKINKALWYIGKVGSYCSL